MGMQFANEGLKEEAKREEARAIARRMTSSVSGSDILKARRMMAQRDQQRDGHGPGYACGAAYSMHMGGMVHNPMAMNMANQMAAVELARRMTSSVSGSDILKAQAMLGMHQPRYY